VAKAITYNNAGVVEAIKRNSGSTKFYPASFQGIIQALDDWEGGSSGGGGGTNVLPENGDLPNTGNTEGDLVVIPNGDGDYFMYVFANGSWERLHITTEEVETAGSAPFALVTDDGVTVRNQKEINAYLDDRITTLSEKGYDDVPIREDLSDLEDKVDQEIADRIEGDQNLLKDIAAENLERTEADAALQDQIDALPVTINDSPPAGEDGDLWFDSDTTLQLFVSYNGDWVVASPPVSTDEIESIATNAEARAEESFQKASAVQFQLDQQAEFIRWDQERQDGMILTLEEELEQLVPSLERGLWNYDSDDNWTPAGNYILVKEFLDEDDQEALCNYDFNACKSACNGDPTCESQCLRAFDACKAAIVGGRWALTNKWAEVQTLGIAYEDARGIDHTFDNVKPGMIVDIFNINDEGFMFAEIEKVNKGPDGISIEFKLLRSAGVANGPATIKFFELEDSVGGDDLTNFVRKTGDTMEGTLKIQSKKNNLQILHIPAMGNVNEVPLVIARDKTEGGSIARFQIGEQLLDGTYRTEDVLKINNKGQLECQDNRITMLGDAEEAHDAVNLRTFEDRANATYVRKDGDTIEGDIEYLGDITDPEHIVNKAYVHAKDSIDQAPWTHGPGSMFHRFLKTNGAAPVKDRDQWKHGVAHYYSNKWSFHNYSLNDWTSIIYDNKSYSPPTSQPYFVWIWLASSGIWAKAEAGMWKTTGWNDNYCIEMQIENRKEFRPIKDGEILCTTFAGFW